MRNEHLLRLIRTIPDVPQPGVMFRDITPLLASPEGFAATVQGLVAVSEELRPTKVVGVAQSRQTSVAGCWPVVFA
jgi:adenine phosphoribosyltransferase